MRLHPYSAGGAYVNFLMGDEGRRTREENLRRQLRAAGRDQKQIRPWIISFA